MTNHFQNMFFDQSHYNDAMQKNFDSFMKACQIGMDNGQAILKRMGEMAQKNITHAIEASKEALSSTSPEQAWKKQQNYIQHTVDHAVSNTKEVMEMVSKSNMEVFEEFTKTAKEKKK
ncbi:MAG: phasin family protein [Rickettsiaceae bacterium]|nr:phasin family protein [Rickettsiaceae bacterium]